MTEELVQIPLSRKNTSFIWGFTLAGGKESNRPIYVIKMIPRSLADRAGLELGDVVIGIGGYHTINATLAAAKAEILRAGNEFSLLVKKNGIDVKDKTYGVVPISYKNYPVVFTGDMRDKPATQSKSFLVLQQSMLTDTQE